MNEGLLRLMDALLGWTLRLPRDATLFLVAVLTAGLILAARRLFADQGLLWRCRDDRRRLKALAREARRRGDRAAIARHRVIKQRLALKALRCEVKPLLAVLLPVALLATWGFHRLGYLPVRDGGPVELIAWFPATAAGRVVHVAPQDGLDSEGGWVRDVAVKGEGETAMGAARWRIRGAARDAPYDLLIRHRGRTHRVGLEIGRPVCSPPLVRFRSADITAAEVRLKVYRPFGFVPGLIGLPPWMVGYLALALPLAAVARRILRLG